MHVPITLYSENCYVLFLFFISQKEPSNPTDDKVYLIQHYVIKFVSDLREVDGFLQVLKFPPPIKLTATI